MILALNAERRLVGGRKLSSRKLSQEVLSSDVEVKSLGAEATLQCKKLDEVMNANDVVSAVSE